MLPAWVEQDSPIGHAHASPHSLKKTNLNPPKKTVKDVDQKKTNDEEQARSLRLIRGTFEPAPTKGVVSFFELPAGSVSTSKMADARLSYPASWLPPTDCNVEQAVSAVSIRPRLWVLFNTSYEEDEVHRPPHTGGRPIRRARRASL